MRRARPTLARQSRAWMSAGAAAWCGLAVAGRQPFRAKLLAGLGWWAAVALMLDWHLGMFESEHGAPRPLGPADALTLLRVWLVPVVADELHPGALLLAAATDVADGIAARASTPTRAGRDLEGLADAAVAVAALRAAQRTGRLARMPIWLESGRLAAGVGYAVLTYFARIDAPDPAVVRAARVTSPVRVAGLVAAGAGRRRWGATLLGGGSIASVAALARGAHRAVNAGP